MKKKILTAILVVASFGIRAGVPEDLSSMCQGVDLTQADQERIDNWFNYSNKSKGMANIKRHYPKLDYKFKGVFGNKVQIETGNGKLSGSRFGKGSERVKILCKGFLAEDFLITLKEHELNIEKQRLAEKKRQVEEQRLIQEEARLLAEEKQKVEQRKLAQKEKLRKEENQKREEEDRLNAQVMDKCLDSGFISSNLNQFDNDNQVKELLKHNSNWHEDKAQLRSLCIAGLDGYSHQYVPTVTQSAKGITFNELMELPVTKNRVKQYEAQIKEAESVIERESERLIDLRLRADKPTAPLEEDVIHYKRSMENKWISKNYRVLQFQIVQRVDANSIEAIVGNEYILIIDFGLFTSTGYASRVVTRGENRIVKMKNGFQRETAVFYDSPNAEAEYQKRLEENGYQQAKSAYERVSEELAYARRYNADLKEQIDKSERLIITSQKVIDDSLPILEKYAVLIDKIEMNK